MISSEATALPVYLRLRPGASKSQFISAEDNKHAVIKSPEDSRHKAEEVFTFNGIFDQNASQLEVFEETLLPLVVHTLNGNNSLWFTIGASGSGKTYTVYGFQQNPGMVHLAIDTIFKSLSGNLAEFEQMEYSSDQKPDRMSCAVEAGLFLDWNKGSSNSQAPLYEERSLFNGEIEPFKYTDSLCAIYISMVEIYNERIFDLFDETSIKDHKRSLILKTDTSNKTYIADLRKVFVTSVEEAFKVIQQGHDSRSANTTDSNNVSSRSHAFTIIEIKRIKGVSIHSSSLTIVDMAGSERNKIAKTTGEWRPGQVLKRFLT